MRARPASEYHEDMGPVLWWRFPIEEAPWVGTPLDLGQEILVSTRADDVRGEIEPCNERETGALRIYVGGWREGYYTHFTPLPETPEATP